MEHKLENEDELWRWWERVEVRGREIERELYLEVVRGEPCGLLRALSCSSRSTFHYHSSIDCCSLVGDKLAQYWTIKIY